MSTQSYEVAHLHEQGQDMIIIPVSSSFAAKSSQQQSAIQASLQSCAESAGLKGTVCPVWESSNRFGFLAPKPWHAFFASIGMDFVSVNINRKLTCKSW